MKNKKFKNLAIISGVISIISIASNKTILGNLFYNVAYFVLLFAIILLTKEVGFNYKDRAKMIWSLIGYLALFFSILGLFIDKCDIYFRYVMLMLGFEVLYVANFDNRILNRLK